MGEVWTCLALCGGSHWLEACWGSCSPEARPDGARPPSEYDHGRARHLAERAPVHAWRHHLSHWDYGHWGGSGQGAHGSLPGPQRPHGDGAGGAGGARTGRTLLTGPHDHPCRDAIPRQSVQSVQCAQREPLHQSVNGGCPVMGWGTEHLEPACQHMGGPEFHARLFVVDSYRRGDPPCLHS